MHLRQREVVASDLFLFCSLIVVIKFLFLILQCTFKFALNSGTKTIVFKEQPKYAGKKIEKVHLYTVIKYLYLKSSNKVKGSLYYTTSASS